MSECEHSNCKEAFEKLDDYLDRVLSEDEMKAVKVHLEKCSHCADEFQFEESVIACLKLKLMHIDLPCELLSKISEAIDKA